MPLAEGDGEYGAWLKALMANLGRGRVCYRCHMLCRTKSYLQRRGFGGVRSDKQNAWCGFEICCMQA